MWEFLNNHPFYSFLYLIVLSFTSIVLFRCLCNLWECNVHLEDREEDDEYEEEE